jgi:hypothetical protein
LYRQQSMYTTSGAHESIRAQQKQAPTCATGNEPKQCPICLEFVDRLVRDHNHQTGYIRGWICDPCNCWLGLLEKYPENYYLRKKPGRKKWRRWVRDNASRIRAHLESNTGLLYGRERNAARNLETGKASVATRGSGAGSRANKSTDTQPKAESSRSPDPQFSDRETWASALIRRAREGLLLALLALPRPHPPPCQLTSTPLVRGWNPRGIYARSVGALLVFPNNCAGGQ